LKAVADVGLAPAYSSSLFVLTPGKTKPVSVEVDNTFFLDAHTLVAVVVGDGPFFVSLRKTDTSGDVVGYIGFSTGSPGYIYNVGATPVTLSSDTTMNSFGVVLLFSGIFAINTSDPPPYAYTLTGIF
jgi:hypothetical protein